MNTFLSIAMLLTVQTQTPTATVSGWTEIAAAPDSRIVYVSSSDGNDANNGLSPGTPKKTLTAGNSLMRNGSPDWLLLKRGDVWSDQSLYWKTSGNSPARMTVVSSYGEGPRPVIKNGAFRYLETLPLRHVAVVGIDIYASYNDPSSPDFAKGTPLGTGIQITPTSADNLLLADDRVRFYDTNVQIRRVNDAGSITNVTIRRNMISNALSFGLLVTWADGVLLEENVFDKCGWEKRTKFLHDVYVKENRRFTARGNIFSRGGNFGLKISADKKESFADFVVEDNLFYKSSLSIGHSAGATGYDPKVDVGTINGAVNRNVFLSPGKLLPYNSTSAQTFAIMIQNLGNVSFDSNVFTHNTEYQNTGEAIGTYSSERCYGVAVTRSKINDWWSNYYKNFGSYLKGFNIVEGLVERDNFPANAQYPDPGRDLTSYSKSIGGEDNNEAFLSIAINQSRDAWDSRYTAKAFNDYIRTGFGF